MSFNSASIKPDWCPPDVWQAAINCAETVLRNLPDEGDLTMEVEQIARTIMAERERCAGIADAYAEVNWASVTDSILLDPVLSNRGKRPLTADDFAKAEDMAVDGTIHSSMYQAATQIAAAIRGQSE